MRIGYLSTTTAHEQSCADNVRKFFQVSLKSVAVLWLALLHRNGHKRLVIIMFLVKLEQIDLHTLHTKYLHVLRTSCLCAPASFVQDLPLYQFRSKPVSLAYDSASKLLAVGCENGKIVMYPCTACSLGYSLLLHSLCYT